MSSRDLRVAIIGAGPSGFYAAEAIVKKLEKVTVDIIEKLPAPYGLVRYGVAPDHQKIKSVTKLYERTAANDRVNLLGNVEFGKDLSLSEIKNHYDAVVFCNGASSDRSLGIPGEELEGSMSATEFVAWYNGLPEYAHHIKSLDAKAVAVIGVGNVAVDVVRILAKSVDELSSSDITAESLEVLKDSKVEDIYMLGRRGPAQGKFTTKELRELGQLLNADIIVDKNELKLDEASEKYALENRAVSINLTVLGEFADKEPEQKPRRVHIKFLVSPVEIGGKDKVESIKLEKNRLEPTSSGYINSVGTGQYETIPVDMVLRSVGYKGIKLPDVPFYDKWGTIPNEDGRVLDEQGGKVVPGLYTAGWIKRGPSGVVGTNKADSAETVDKLLEDFANVELKDDPAKTTQAVLDVLKTKGVQVVSFEEWKKLDAYELARGKEENRPRVKVVDIDKMIQIAKS